MSCPVRLTCPVCCLPWCISVCGRDPASVDFVMGPAPTLFVFPRLVLGCCVSWSSMSTGRSLTAPVLLGVVDVVGLAPSVCLLVMPPPPSR